MAASEDTHEDDVEIREDNVSMSYSESNGQVILTMSREDYEALLYWLGLAAGTTYYDVENIGLLMNRLNSGNPHYTPYQVEDKS